MKLELIKNYDLFKDLIKRRKIKNIISNNVYAQYLIDKLFEKDEPNSKPKHKKKKFIPRPGAQLPPIPVPSIQRKGVSRPKKKVCVDVKKSLEDVRDDAILNILLFVELKDIYSFIKTNKRYFALLFNDQNNPVWWSVLKYKFGLSNKEIIDLSLKITCLEIIKIICVALTNIEKLTEQSKQHLLTNFSLYTTIITANRNNEFGKLFNPNYLEKLNSSKENVIFFVSICVNQTESQSDEDFEDYRYYFHETFKSLKEEYKNDKEIMEIAIKTNPELYITHIGEELQKNNQFMFNSYLVFVTTFPDAFENVDKLSPALKGFADILKDGNFIEQALEINFEVSEYLSDKYSVYINRAQLQRTRREFEKKLYEMEELIIVPSFLHNRYTEKEFIPENFILGKIKFTCCPEFIRDAFLHFDKKHFNSLFVNCGFPIKIKYSCLSEDFSNIAGTCTEYTLSKVEFSIKINIIMHGGLKRVIHVETLLHEMIHLYIKVILVKLQELQELQELQDFEDFELVDKEIVDKIKEVYFYLSRHVSNMEVLNIVKNSTFLDKIHIENAIQVYEYIISNPNNKISDEDWKRLRIKMIQEIESRESHGEVFRILMERVNKSEKFLNITTHV